MNPAPGNGGGVFYWQFLLVIVNQQERNAMDMNI
jgi:hypothetical protein